MAVFINSIGYCGMLRCFLVGSVEYMSIPVCQVEGGSVSSVGRACRLQSGRSRVRFPGPDQYSGS